MMHREKKKNCIVADKTEMRNAKFIFYRETIMWLTIRSKMKQKF